MTSKSAKSAAKYFRPQPQPDMCETTSVKIILDELSARHKKPRLKVSIKTLNKYYSYRRGSGTDSVVGIDELNDHVNSQGYRVRVEYGSGSTMEILKQIVEKDDCSFPIISVNHAYFQEQNLRYKTSGETKMEHVLVVLGVNRDVQFFDPYESFLMKSTHVDEVCNSLSKPKVLNLWDNTVQPRWMVWIERVEPRLEHYGVSVSEED
ncbi:MAG: hypothetical protein V3U09_08170 [Thermoplasmata archaeon]